MVTNYRCGSSIDEMELADDGEWMRYEEHAAIVAEYEQRLTAALGLIEQQQAAMTVLVESSQTAVNFLDSVEWTDTTSEHDAADAQQALEQAIAQAEGETPRDQPQRSRLSDDDVHP
jgi:hypothetical protein